MMFFSRKQRLSSFQVSTACLLLALCGAKAGTWSSVQLKNDGDLPKPAPEKVTHAVAFGIDATPPAPEPFQITNKISGENWSMWKYPEHSASVIVTRRPENVVESIRVKGAGAALIRGKIFPKTNQGGLILELNGLDPGQKYKLVLFGLFLLTPEPDLHGGFQTTVRASDNPDQSEVLKLPGSEPYFVYEYTAPSDGQLSISFECGVGDAAVGVMRMCAFLNYRAD